MALFRWRRRAKTAAYVPRHTASWAAPAYPQPLPVDCDENDLSRGPERSFSSQSTSGGDPSVRLGFADGTEVELAASHPNAVALRAVADLLVQDERRPAEN